MLKNKVIAAGLAAVVVSTAFVGCSQSNKASNASSSAAASSATPKASTAPAAPRTQAPLETLNPPATAREVAYLKDQKINLESADALTSVNEARKLCTEATAMSEADLVAFLKKQKGETLKKDITILSSVCDNAGRFDNAIQKASPES